MDGSRWRLLIYEGGSVHIYLYSLFVLNQSLMQATKRPAIVGDYIFFSPLLAYSVQPTFSPQAWKSVGAGIVSCRGTIVA